MIVELTENKKLIKFLEYDEIEIEQMSISFKRRMRDFYKKRSRMKNKSWDGYTNYLKSIGGIYYLPVGLWGELLEICEKYNIEINKEFIKDLVDDIDKEEVANFINGLLEGSDMKSREYQIDSVYRMLKYRKCLSEIATSAGKTFMTFCTFAYLKNNWERLGNGKPFKFLMIVPRVDLILQGMEDFESYSKSNNFKYNLKPLYKDIKDRDLEGYDTVIGTFQTLSRLNPKTLEDFTVVMLDEAHYGNAVTVKKVISDCVNAKYVYGVSGTLMQDDKTSDEYTLYEHIGPLVNHIPAHFLIDNNFATPIHVNIFRLNYLEKEKREKLHKIRCSKEETLDGSKILKLESDIAKESEKRLKFIAKMISKTKKNSLVLFKTVKEGYGKKLYEHLRINCTEKDFYYVDGGTEVDSRDYYKGMLEKEEDKVLIASYGTFSTGISIKNIHTIFLVESYKSDKIIKQSIGRAMRQMQDKKRAVILDFVDDMRKTKNSKNILYRQGEERLKIYKQERYSYKIYKVSL